MLTIVEPPDIIPEGTSSDMNVGEGGQVNILPLRPYHFHSTEQEKVSSIDNGGRALLHFNNRKNNSNSFKYGVDFHQEPFARSLVDSMSKNPAARARAYRNKFASKYASKRDALWRY